MKKILLATSSVLLSATLAQAGVIVKVGTGNIDIANSSESATTIGAEFQKNPDAKLGFMFELDGYFAEDVTTTYFGLGGKYKINNNINLKATAGLSGVTFDTDDSSNTDLQGFVYGVGATYTFAKKHNIILDYKSGTVSDESGLVDVDVTYTSISYGYSF